MRHDVWRALTTLACVIAAGTCFAAVALHAMEIAAGYELGEQEARQRVLAREVRAAEQRIAALESPAAVLARGAEMGLVTVYSDRPLVIRAEDVRILLDLSAGPETYAFVGDR